MLVLLNPHAGSAGEADPVRRWAADRGHELRETQSAEEARSAAAEAARAGRVVVAVGGDGSIHGVAQGLLDGGARPTLGVVPLGTGNDLARSLGLEAGVAAALEAIDGGRRRPIDALRIEAGGRVRWCLNVASGGFSGALTEEVTEERKERWGPLAYVLASVSAAPELEPYELELELDGERRTLDGVVNLVLANGRFAAGGFQVAPEARLDDGRADVIVIRGGTWLERASVGVQMAAGDYTQADAVVSLRGRRGAFRFSREVGFSLDGERVELREASFEVAAAALETFSRSGQQQPADQHGDRE